MTEGPALLPLSFPAVLCCVVRGPQLPRGVASLSPISLSLGLAGNVDKYRLGLYLTIRLVSVFLKYSPYSYSTPTTNSHLTLPKCLCFGVCFVKLNMVISAGYLEQRREC